MEEIGINGMAHVVLTVSRYAECRAFYARLLPRLGMKPVFDGPKFFYCVGARTAIGIEPCDPAHASERFDQGRVGLHHLCLRARTREDVDRVAVLLRELVRAGRLSQKRAGAVEEQFPRGCRKWPVLGDCGHGLRCDGSVDARLDA